MYEHTSESLGLEFSVSYSKYRPGFVKPCGLESTWWEGVSGSGFMCNFLCSLNPISLCFFGPSFKFNLIAFMHFPSYPFPYENEMQFCVRRLCCLDC